MFAVVFRRSLFLIALVAARTPLPAVEYEKDIMPIFMEKCADCHSEKSEKVKGGLKFDDPGHFQKRFSKNSVVVPGDFDASYLFLTIFRPEGDEDAMPPKGKGEHLTSDEVKLVLEWIQDGAPINGERGDRGEMPENMEDLLRDLPVSAGGAVGAAAAGAGGLPKMGEEQKWTNREGQTIVATLLKVDGEFAVLRMENGVVHRYPIEKLSAESQEKLKKP